MYPYFRNRRDDNFLTASCQTKRGTMIVSVNSRRDASPMTIIATMVVLILLVTQIPGVEAASTKGYHVKAPRSTSSSSTTSTSTTSAQTVSTTTKTSSSTSTSSTTSTTTSFKVAGYSGCIDASDEISGFTCSWLSSTSAELKPTTNSSIGWSVVFNDASYDNIESSSQSSTQSGLNMLLATGASCVRIDVGYDAWLTDNVTAQDELNNFTSQIKSAGKCLVIADASAEIYRKSPLNWTNFQIAWIQRVQTIAEIFKPSYYIVIKEPGWYVPMVSDASTNPQFQNATVWVQLTNSLANAVHSVSPSTQVGISIGGGISNNTYSFYLSLLQGASKLNGVSFIGYDGYCSDDWKLDLNLEAQVLTTKPIWIAEAWSTANSSVVYNSDRAALDAYWIQVLYYYGLYIHASVIEPFFTDTFASYSQPANFSQRTFVYYWFQHLATTYGQPIQP